jgi:transcriptional regulator GlxA family with amidase domain
MYQQNAFSSVESTRAMHALMSSYGARRDSSSTVVQLQSVVGELLVALNSALTDKRDSAQQSLSRAASLLQTEEESRPATTAVKGGLAPWQVRKVTAHVETNLDKPIRSSDLAVAVRLTPCHFSRVFRTSFGESPLRYVTKRRLERAKQLMLSTDSPLCQIALDCGFSDQAHFSRLFRRMAGDTPRAWRRSYIDPQRTALRGREPVNGARPRDVRRLG